MNWTREAPTETGFYWFYDCDQLQMSIAHISDIEIYYGTGLRAAFTDEDHLIPLSRVWGYWMGPIEVPEGPNEGFGDG